MSLFYTKSWKFLSSVFSNLFYCFFKIFFIATFHSAVVFQRYLIYYILLNAQTVMMVQKPKVINEKSHFGMLFKNICTMKIGNLTILIVKYNYNNDL